MPEGASEYDDHSQIEFQLTQTSCGCSLTESTGHPSNFTVAQHLGRLYFSWVDKVRGCVELASCSSVSNFS